MRIKGCSWGCTGVFVVWLVLTIVDFVPLAWLVTRCEERARTQAVGRKVPDAFPVLVLTPVPAGSTLSANIVLHSQVAGYVKKHPGTRFTVPLDQVDAIRYDLGRSREWRGRGPWFEVEQLVSGKQLFRVRCRWDYDTRTVGWYEASADGVVPKRYLHYYGAFVMMESSVAIALLNLVVAMPIVGALERWAEKRRRAAALQRRLTIDQQTLER